MTPDHIPPAPEGSIDPASAGIALQDRARAGRLTWRASILVILALSVSLWVIVWFFMMRLLL